MKRFKYRRVLNKTLLPAVLLLAFNVQLNLTTRAAVRINQILLCDIARLHKRWRDELSRGRKDTHAGFSDLHACIYH